MQSCGSFCYQNEDLCFEIYFVSFQIVFLAKKDYFLRVLGSKMLDNFFKGDIPSIFETTIKREKSKAAENSSASKLKDYRNEEEFLRSVKATICYCGSFWTFGMAAAVIGPTLLELGCVTNRPVNVMSWVFFSQALSALFGSSLGGFLADRYSFDSVLNI